MTPTKPFFLFVGDLSAWQRSGRVTPRVDQSAFVDLADLTVETLRRHAPDIVLCPLFVPSFDACDVALKLTELGFQGLLRAVTRPLPRPELVLAEIAQIAPDIDFDVLVIGAEGLPIGD